MNFNDKPDGTMSERQAKAVELQMELMMGDTPDVGTPEKIGRDELYRMVTAKTMEEYYEAVTAVKQSRGGRYPNDWFAKTQMSGLAHAIMTRLENKNPVKI